MLCESESVVDGPFNVWQIARSEKEMDADSEDSFSVMT